MTMNKGAVALYNWRRAAELSQTAAGKALGLHQSDVSQYEIGKKIPSADRAALFQKLAGIDPADWAAEATEVPVKAASKRRKRSTTKTDKPSAPKAASVAPPKVDPKIIRVPDVPPALTVWRASMAHRLIPVLYVTAVTVVEAAQKALDQGFDPYITTIECLGEVH